MEHSTDAICYAVAAADATYHAMRHAMRHAVRHAMRAMQFTVTQAWLPAARSGGVWRMSRTEWLLYCGSQSGTCSKPDTMHDIVHATHQSGTDR